MEGGDKIHNPLEMFYLNTIEQLFLFVEQLDQLEVCLTHSSLLAGIPILAVFQNLRWYSNKTSLHCSNQLFAISGEGTRYPITNSVSRRLCAPQNINLEQSILTQSVRRCPRSYVEPENARFKSQRRRSVTTRRLPHWWMFLKRFALFNQLNSVSLSQN